MSNSLGLDNKSISYDDLKHSDLIFVIGANPTSNHPKFAEILRNHRESGGNVIAQVLRIEIRRLSARDGDFPWNLVIMTTTTYNDYL